MVKYSKLLVGLLLLLLAQYNFSCSKSDKIPITTSSKEALSLYLQGLDLADKLRGQESLDFFEQATTLDSNFALAHLNKSFNQPSTRGFFYHFNKAKSLLNKVSEGERLWILAVEAFANGLRMQERQYYEQLVAKYPNDERAHNLLGHHYFNQQEYEKAIDEYNKAIALNPDFSQPYNQMGYAYRYIEEYALAEEAFEKYIKLIPDEANPYDSYAELLLKMGEYEVSLEYYEKALTINPNFIASHIGIAANLIFKKENSEARRRLQQFYNIARNDGERRLTHFAMAVAFANEGDLINAKSEIQKQYALSEKNDDTANMAGDLLILANIWFESNKPDSAIIYYENARTLVEISDLPEEIKENARRVYPYAQARVAIAKKDYLNAEKKAQEFVTKVKEVGNPDLDRLGHEILGMIYLAEEKFDKAIIELNQADQEDPYNLFRLALAYENKGNTQNAIDLLDKVVKYNILNIQSLQLSLNYSFIRDKAERKLARLKASL